MVDTEQRLEQTLPPELASVPKARQFASAAAAWAPAVAAEDLAIIVTELATNAVLHARTPFTVSVARVGSGLRIEVHDSSSLPIVSTPTAELVDAPSDPLAVEGMTGRGIRIVAAYADAWGVEEAGEGKVVWAELGTGRTHAPPPPAAAEPAAHSVPSGGAPAHEDDFPPAPAADQDIAHPPEPGERTVRYVAVPVRLALASETNLDELDRELQVIAAGATSESVPDSLRDAVDGLFRRSDERRVEVRRLAGEAAARGRRLVDMTLSLPLSAADDARDLLAALDRLNQLCRDGVLLPLPASEELAEFQHWFQSETARQLGGALPRACPLPVVHPDDTGVEGARGQATRPPRDELDPGQAAALDAIEAELRDLTDASVVARTILVRAVESVGGTTGSLCVLQPDGLTVTILADLGYGTAVQSHWATFPVSADLPASDVIRTGEMVVIRTAAERDLLYPVFATTPVVANDAFAIMPMRVEGRGSLGALVIGYAEPRDIPEHDRRYLLALGCLAGEALEPMLA